MSGLFLQHGVVKLMVSQKPDAFLEAMADRFALQPILRIVNVQSHLVDHGHAVQLRLGYLVTCWGLSEVSDCR